MKFSKSAEDRPKAHSVEALFPRIPCGLAGKYLVFELAGEEYGLPLQKVQEIVLTEALHPAEKTSSYTLGTLDLRGDRVPVIDLRRRLHVREKKNDFRTCIVIANITLAPGRTAPAGFLVDAVEDVRSFAPEAIEETPYTEQGRPGAFMGVARCSGHQQEPGTPVAHPETVTLLDPDPLLSATDLAELLR